MGRAGLSAGSAVTQHQLCSFNCNKLLCSRLGLPCPAGAHPALCVLCCSEGAKAVAAPRPDRLVNRLKSINLDDANAPRLTVLRQPRGPDNSKVQHQNTGQHLCRGCWAREQRCWVRLLVFVHSAPCQGCVLCFQSSTQQRSSPLLPVLEPFWLMVCLGLVCSSFINLRGSK